MPKIQLTFTNRAEHPIFIYVEMTPDCYKLQSGDQLTIIDDVPVGSKFPEIDFASKEELTIWPACCTNPHRVIGRSTPEPEIAEPEVLVNGKSAKGLSWNWDREAGPGRWKNFP